MEKTVSKLVDQVTEYPSGTCGSCHWQRPATQFNVVRPACMALPKQALCVGTNIAFVNPIIDDLHAVCAMWKPLEEDTQ
jgi:hypothetical protein